MFYFEKSLSDPCDLIKMTPCSVMLSCFLWLNGQSIFQQTEIKPGPCSSVSLKKVFNKQVCAWKTGDIKKRKRNCRKAERKWRKNKLTIDYQTMRKQLKIYNSAGWNSRNEYFSKTINSHKNNPSFSPLIIWLVLTLLLIHRLQLTFFVNSFSNHFRGNTKSIRASILSE